MQELAKYSEDELHPIDSVEEVLTANNWTFHRASDDELVLEVSGKNSKYHLCFIWQEKMNALQFACRHNITVDETNITKARDTIQAINEDLWLGHFDLPADTANPVFRYTSLFHGAGKASATDVIEDIVDVALIQCEKYYPVLELFSKGSSNTLNDSNMSLALMETIGES